MVLADTKTLDGIPLETLTKGSDKKVKLICNDCGKESTTTWNNYNNAQKRGNRNGETYCKSCASKKKAFKRRGVKWKKKPHQILTRENHPSWKGGKYISSDGYIMVNVKVGRDEKNSGWTSYRKEHIMLIEEALNRPLNSGEQVHHINGIKTDNNVSNLFLVTSSKEHRDVHSSLVDIAYSLIQAGHIKFDRENKIYVADQKLRELLEHPEEGNQQPSLSGNTLEGSETRDESYE